jgi:DNA polymerase III subunit gamma/tau
MAYLVLARKYRPQTFDAVVGQDHVTQTLNNAISGGRVAHAILFSGPRGTGKTTIARILAKAMNCETGPTATPCNVCRSCKDITAGRAVDVFEIDGASNNSVDQVRELRDNSRYMPAHSRYKIYIIDEVHMLSIAAFNALLKTLEEPPAHVMFLFATTEPHKIPITILSRCQRHDLRRIDPKDVSKQLDALCRQESVSISQANLWAIARESGGSLRDALSLLDQVLACSDGQVDDDYVAGLLGGMDRQLLFDISAAVFARDITRIVALIDEVFKSGQDMKRFYADLLMHFRHLMLVKMDAHPDVLVDLPHSEIEMMAEQVKGVSTAFIDQVFTLLFNAETRVRQASQPRLAIEVAFFKIHQITPALPIDLLIERMDTILNDPQLRSSPGVVEVQSAYGNAGAPALSAASGHSASGDRSAGEQSDSDGPSGMAVRRSSDTSVDLDDDWGRVISVIAETKPSISAALSRSQLVSASARTFRVSVRDNDYSINLIKRNLSMIETVCSEHAGRELKIDFSVHEADERHTAKATQKANDLKQQLLNHPLVADAVDIFNGKIEEIKIR